jgi:hypothetical protein
LFAKNAHRVGPEGKRPHPGRAERSGGCRRVMGNEEEGLRAQQPEPIQAQWV